MPTARNSDPRFDLEPPSASVRAWFFALAVVLPLAITCAALWQVFSSEVPTALVGTARVTALGSVAAVCVVALTLWWVIDRLLRRHRLLIGAHGLEIATTFHRRTLALTELDLAAARVVDLGERTELKPGLRTNGTSLPGFRSGWYRLRNRRRAFVAMTTGPRVLFVPTRNGYDLLLQPRQPQALLDQLRTLATAAERR